MRGELGGACCAFARGEKIVDLWGGIRNKETAEPWEHDTMVVVHSTTEGLAAMTRAIAHSRGPGSLHFYPSRDQQRPILSDLCVFLLHAHRSRGTVAL